MLKIVIGKCEAIGCRFNKNGKCTLLNSKDFYIYCDAYEPKN